MINLFIEKASIFFSDLIILEIIIFSAFFINLFFEKYTYFSLRNLILFKVKSIFYKDPGFIFAMLIFYSFIAKVFLMTFNYYWLK
jgi:hypothetical protein